MSADPPTATGHAQRRESPGASRAGGPRPRPTSRRALLAVAAVAVAGVADALAQATPASAAAGDNFVLGAPNDAGSSETDLTSSASGTASTLAVVNSAAGASLIDANAIYAQVDSGSSATISVVNPGSGPCLYATDGGGTGPGVWADLSSFDPSPAVQADTAGTGPAVSAQITNTASSAAALLATTAGTGPALQVEGKVAFSRSGVAAIAAGKTAVKVTLAGVTASSLVLATLQQVLAGVVIAGAVPGSGSFTIHLTNAPSKRVKVAWFVID